MEKSLYVVSGRVPFDDEDSTHLIMAVTEGEAMDAFKAELNKDRDAKDIKASEREHGTSIFVINCTKIGEYLMNGFLKVTTEVIDAGDPNEIDVSLVILGGYEIGEDVDQPGMFVWHGADISYHSRAEAYKAAARLVSEHAMRYHNLPKEVWEATSNRAKLELVREALNK